MPIDENLLFQTFFAKNPEKPIELVMQDVARAKAAYVKALQEFAPQDKSTVTHVLEMPLHPVEREVMEEAVPTVKRLTKRSLKVQDTQSAIGDESITCCLCGAQLKFISSTHLKLHGTTPELYRKLCDYDPKQPLMAKNYYKKMQETIANAQKGRRRKKMIAQGDAD